MFLEISCICLEEMVNGEPACISMSPFEVLEALIYG